ncbi:uncharacterized protein [Parasteatoda tepidariorum]|uniref:uncharacterized protein isoform X2 n=1 Tax=Parasteatoda tepidariorum TaxID=114398 RepID=UPI0039BC7EE9
MSVALQEPEIRPFRVPGYAGYVPGLKYTFGHTYGYDESRLFKSSHPDFSSEFATQKLIPYQPANRRDSSTTRVTQDACLQRNGVHQKISKIDDLQQQRRVQWTDGRSEQASKQGSMDIINADESFMQKHAAIQCSLEEFLEKEQEREGIRSAATQWSDQEAHRKKKYSAATQWTPVDFSPLKTIPGYTGHLPGRNNVNPGKTFCQEMDALLTTFNPKQATIYPMSRHNFTSALQQLPERPPEGKDDPYFDNRPPSTYANNYPIPGYQGFVPHVRTSTSSLGIRYIKAVEKSLNALHTQQNKKALAKCLSDEEIANSPKKLLDKRPLHTPRHKPHPRQQALDENDWRIVYKRPPSTYLDSSKTYIPGYRGFIPKLKGSPNTVGVRYSKAALRCLENAHKAMKTQNPDDAQEVEHQENQEYLSNEQEDGDENKENEEHIDESEEVNDTGNPSKGEKTASNMKENRLQRNVSAERPYKQQHSDYLKDRKPSTYRSDERHPIPGYQGFVPRLRDSPTTLGLRYTKAAIKSLEDVHKKQCKTTS